MATHDEHEEEKLGYSHEFSTKPGQVELVEEDLPAVRDGVDLRIP